MTTLYVASSKGVHACSWDGQVKSLGLVGKVVSQAVLSGNVMLAAVPVLQEVHAMMSYVENKSTTQKAGVYRLDLSDTQPCQVNLVYEGNAKSCAIGSESSSGKKRWYAGTEPADVLISEDEGKTWSDTSSFAAIEGRKEWTFPAPPNTPHTLSIDFAPDTSSKSNTSAEDLVIAGIEVGGCLVMTPDHMWESRHGKSETANVARVGGQTLDSLPDALKTLTHTDIDRLQLCVDVHQCRPDPFDPSRWFATCGATPQVVGEGGCFVTDDQGHSWRRIFDGGPGQQQSKTIGKGLGYAIGLALNPHKQGEILITTGDRPPGIGCHVHHSSDGGKSFQDITDQIYRKEQLQDCKGEHTPVPYFVQEGALLGSDTGDIITCKDIKQGGWRKLCKVLGHITTILVQDRSPSSVTH